MMNVNHCQGLAPLSPESLKALGVIKLVIVSTHGTKVSTHRAITMDASLPGLIIICARVKS